MHAEPHISPKRLLVLTTKRSGADSRIDRRVTAPLLEYLPARSVMGRRTRRSATLPRSLHSNVGEDTLPDIKGHHARRAA